MAEIVDYKNLKVCSPEPVGEAGQALNDNFRTIADDLEGLKGDVASAQQSIAGKADEIHEHTPTQISGLMGGDGKIALNYIPQTAITDVHVVASQEQQDNLTVEKGDVVIRTDQNKNWIYDGSGFQQLLVPPDLVQSVNGKIGAVSLTYTDVGAASSGHNHTNFPFLDLGTSLVVGKQMATDAYCAIYLNESDSPQEGPEWFSLQPGHTVMIDVFPGAMDEQEQVFVHGEGQHLEVVNTTESERWYWLEVNLQSSYPMWATGVAGLWASLQIYDQFFSFVADSSAFIPTGDGSTYVVPSFGSASYLTLKPSPYYAGATTLNGDLHHHGSAWLDEVFVGQNGTGNGWVTCSEVLCGHIQTNTIGSHSITGHTTFGNGVNVIFNTNTGTMLGTAAGQKLGFHGAPPTAKRVGAAQAAVPATPTVQQLATLTNELRAALVEKGLIKGSA